jgi:alpha-D-xyloside xylohydrolase
MMRALVMDFAKDKNALDINDQFMFGKSLLVSPVTNAMYVKPAVEGRDTIRVEDFDKVKMKETYLPAGADWYDFWTGEKMAGGQKVKKETPIDIIPVYVKAGSMMPIGPDVQYAAEKKWDHLQIRVYPGADGKFVLYEDENDNYNYEKGIYTTITFNWDDKKRTLTIGDRTGSFPGMTDSRTFSFVIVTASKGGEGNTVVKPDAEVTYSGKKVIVKL